MSARPQRSSPCRTLLAERILPAVAAEGGKVLFIGCCEATGAYHKIIEAFGAECWTIDVDHRTARYGHEGRHLVGDVRQLDNLFDTNMFNSVVMNGLFGFGLNEYRSQAASIAACAKVLRPGGMLVLGWNDVRGHPSLLEELAHRWFDYRPFAGLPSRVWVNRTDHNYAFLRRRGDTHGIRSSRRGVAIVGRRTCCADQKSWLAAR